MVVERSLGFLKGRFRKLKTQMEVDKIEDAPVIIVAACVLHNVCLMDNEDDIEDFTDDKVMTMMMMLHHVQMVKIRGIK